MPNPSTLPPEKGPSTPKTPDTVAGSRTERLLFYVAIAVLSIAMIVVVVFSLSA